MKRTSNKQRQLLLRYIYEGEVHLEAEATALVKTQDDCFNFLYELLEALEHLDSTISRSKDGAFSARARIDTLLDAAHSAPASAEGRSKSKTDRAQETWRLRDLSHPLGACALGAAATLLLYILAPKPIPSVSSQVPIALSQPPLYGLPEQIGISNSRSVSPWGWGLGLGIDLEHAQVRGMVLSPPQLKVLAHTRKLWTQAPLSERLCPQRPQPDVCRAGLGAYRLVRALETDPSKTALIALASGAEGEAFLSWLRRREPEVGSALALSLSDGRLSSSEGRLWAAVLNRTIPLLQQP